MALTRGTFGLKEGQFFGPERYTGAPVVVAYTKGLVTDYGEGGGATKREGGGHVKFYPSEKGRGWGGWRGEKCVSHAERGTQTVLG